MATAIENLTEYQETDVLNIPHAGKILRVSMNKNTGDYFELRKRLNSQGLRMPTIGEQISIFYVLGAENLSKDLECSTWIWGDTGSLYMPRRSYEKSNGVFIQDHPENDGNLLLMDNQDLIQRLENSDPTVRLVPFGYKYFTQDLKDLRKNTFLLGLLGEPNTAQTQVEKLIELISQRGERGIFLRTLDYSTNPISKVSSLFYSDCLNVSGLANPTSRDGYTFAIKESA